MLVNAWRDPDGGRVVSIGWITLERPIPITEFESKLFGVADGDPLLGGTAVIVRPIPMPPHPDDVAHVRRILHRKIDDRRGMGAFL